MWLIWHLLILVVVHTSPDIKCSGMIFFCKMTVYRIWFFILWTLLGFYIVVPPKKYWLISDNHVKSKWVNFCDLKCYNCGKNIMQSASENKHWQAKTSTHHFVFSCRWFWCWIWWRNRTFWTGMWWIYEGLCFKDLPGWVSGLSQDRPFLTIKSDTLFVFIVTVVTWK